MYLTHHRVIYSDYLDLLKITEWRVKRNIWTGIELRYWINIK